MGDYATLKSRIAREINRTDLAHDIEDAIQDAIIHYQFEPLGFNQSMQDLALQKGQYTVKLDEDILHIEQIFIHHNPLLRVANLPGGFIYAVPGQFSVHLPHLYLYPAPDAAYTLQCRIICALPPLQFDSDKNGWTNQAAALIRAKAMSLLYQNRLHDMERARYFDYIAHKEHMLLTLHNIHMISTGTFQTEPCF